MKEGPGKGEVSMVSILDYMLAPRNLKSKIFLNIKNVNLI